MDRDAKLPIIDVWEEALRADSALMAEFGGKVRLYRGTVPSRATYPFILLRMGDTVDSAVDCGADDDDISFSSEVTNYLDIFVREAKLPDSGDRAAHLTGLAKFVILRRFALPAHNIPELPTVSDQALTDPDGITAHTVITVTNSVDFVG